MSHFHWPFLFLTCGELDVNAPLMISEVLPKVTTGDDATKLSLTIG